MGKKKIVVDTNNLISALGWKGPSNKILKKIIDGELILTLSKDQLKELKRVMDYPKFSFSEEEKIRFLGILVETARIIDIPKKLKLIKEDPDDNVILETAIESGSDYIISGDRHLLELKQYCRIRILTASDFLGL